MLDFFSSVLARLQSRYEPAVSTFKGRLGGNVSEALQRVLEAARPLLGLRDLENQDWYNSYPLLAAYLEMDRTGEGKSELKMAVLASQDGYCLLFSHSTHTHTHTHTHTQTSSTGVIDCLVWQLPFMDV